MVILLNKYIPVVSDIYWTVPVIGAKPSILLNLSYKVGKPCGADFNNVGGGKKGQLCEFRYVYTVLGIVLWNGFFWELTNQCFSKICPYQGQISDLFPARLYTNTSFVYFVQCKFLKCIWMASYFRGILQLKWQSQQMCSKIAINYSISCEISF